MALEDTSMFLTVTDPLSGLKGFLFANEGEAPIPIKATIERSCPTLLRLRFENERVIFVCTQAPGSKRKETLWPASAAASPAFLAFTVSSKLLIK